MTSMMKATTPKFETCLFGPSGIPIPIQAYQDTCTEQSNTDTTDTTDTIANNSDNSDNVEGKEEKKT